MKVVELSYKRCDLELEKKLNLAIEKMSSHLNTSDSFVSKRTPLNFHFHRSTLKHLFDQQKSLISLAFPVDRRKLRISRKVSQVKNWRQKNTEYNTFENVDFVLGSRRFVNNVQDYFKCASLIHYYIHIEL